jgi:hypothetical protein
MYFLFLCSYPVLQFGWTRATGKGEIWKLGRRYAPLASLRLGSFIATPKQATSKGGGKQRWYARVAIFSRPLFLTHAVRGLQKQPHRRSHYNVIISGGYSIKRHYPIVMKQTLNCCWLAAITESRAI